MPRSTPVEPGSGRGVGTDRPLSIPVAQPADVAGVVAVAQTCGAQPSDLAERIARWVADDARLVLVAVAADVVGHDATEPLVVGWGMVSRWAPDDAPPGHVVSALTVDPRWWRQGLGARLLAGLQRWTWDRDHELWSIVNARNEASLALHARLGFVEVRRAAGFGGVTFDGGEGLLLRAGRDDSCDDSAGSGPAMAGSRGIVEVKGWSP